MGISPRRAVFQSCPTAKTQQFTSGPRSHRRTSHFAFHLPKPRFRTLSRLCPGSERVSVFATTSTIDGRLQPNLIVRMEARRPEWFLPRNFALGVMRNLRMRRLHVCIVQYTPTGAADSKMEVTTGPGSLSDDLSCIYSTLLSTFSQKSQPAGLLQRMRDGPCFGELNYVDPTLSLDIPRLAIGRFLESAGAEIGL